ncbi:MAG: M48 family metallopeptidase [Oscillospiraceae bacterium]|nr:M48 family metallopeptidase [Oscillospiraceae bacterium]
MSMDYEVRRSARRKTIALAVKADGSVVVHAPAHLAEREIERFVASHSAWLARAIERRAAYNASHPEPTAQQRAELMERARAILPGRVAFYAAQMGLHPTALRITSARTRFGSCSGKNALSFSWRLMQYPMEAVDYVVVHELAHIREHNHSSAFYAIVERYLPDWRERAALLKK